MRNLRVAIPRARTINFSLERGRIRSGVTHRFRSVDDPGVVAELEHPEDRREDAEPEAEGQALKEHTGLV